MADITWITNWNDRDVGEWLATHLDAEGAKTEGKIPVTVPGGSTPFPILAEWAQLPMDFARLEIWPGDDRIVPEDHPSSNTGRIRAALGPVGATIIPLVEDALPPRFALAWLGLGYDGHIASLFPNMEPSSNDPARIRRLVPNPLPAEAPFARISMTIPTLLNSEALLFVFRGRDRRTLFEQAAAGANDLPVARLLAAARQPITCFC